MGAISKKRVTMMSLQLLVCLLFSMSLVDAKSCNNKVTFPVQAFKGFRAKSPQFIWQVNAFGIKIVGTSKSKGKLQHAAQILAELLDNDNDGCPDDAKAFKLLKAGWEGFKPVLLVYDKDEVSNHLGNDWSSVIEKAGYYAGQLMGNWEINPCGRAKLFAKGCYDAAQEEISHWIHQRGYVKAYPKYFDPAWHSNGTTSNLTRAMDLARGGRTQKVFNPRTLYPAKAWYTYDDTSCTYSCQAIEYLWWGYLSYSGSGAGLVGAKQSKEFKYMKKADLENKDKALTKLFQDSKNGKVPYKLPSGPVDGLYDGCAKCNVAGLASHGGSIGGSATAAPT